MAAELILQTEGKELRMREDSIHVGELKEQGV